MEPIHLVRFNDAGEEESRTLYLKSFLPRSGKQGILGILSGSSDPADTSELYIFKISVYLNYTCRQEDIVMQDLNELEGFCPHFCKTHGVYTVRVNPNFREGNPFNLKHVRTPIEVDLLLMQYIENSHKFFRYISNMRVDDEVNFSILKQSMVAVVMAQREKQFAHYDLHSNNILVTRTDPSLLHFYILDDGTPFLVPTYGFTPTIIDFGFSYSNGMEGRPIYGALAHTDAGFMSTCYDDSGDTRLMLSSISFDMVHLRGKKLHRRFRNECKYILRGLDIDLDCGWDNHEDEISASDYILSLLDTEMKQSRFFDEAGHFAVDILQNLITLPLKPRKIPDLFQSFILVRTEFLKLEEEIGSNFFLLYIFKKAVEGVGALKDIYMDVDEKKALKAFRHHMYAVIDSVAQYARAKLDYEKLFVGLLAMARSCEGLLYKVMETRMREKERQKRKMKIRDLGDILSVLYYKYQDDYDLDSRSTILVFDQRKRSQYLLPLSEDDIETFNSMDDLYERNAWLLEKADEM